MEPDSKLLSLLEKLIIQQKHLISILLSKITDETNPAIFTNHFYYKGKEIFCKIRLRVETEKEIYMKTTKKNKKDSKCSEKGEIIKQTIAQEEEEELQKQQHLLTLSEQEKWFFISEDEFTTDSIYFEETHSIAITNVRQFEEEILEQQNTILFIKQSAVTEERNYLIVERQDQEFEQC